MINRILNVCLLLAVTAATQFVSAQTVAQAPTSYYRLRISFNTKSDWASLETSDPRVLLNRQMGTQGAPSVYTLTTNQVMIGQPGNAAAAGVAVGVTVDYAIAATNLTSSPLVFNIRGGDLNNSWAAIWNMNGLVPTFFQLADTLTTPGGTRGGKSVAFSLSGSTLAQLSQSQIASWQTPAIQKMAWAFYYPWYPYMDNWNNPEFKDLPAQLYTSGDPAAIARQISQAKSAGLDGFISSWSGPGTWTDTFLKPILDGAQAQNFAVTPYFETLDANGNPQSPATIVSWLTYLLRTYGNHPASSASARVPSTCKHRKSKMV